MDETQKREVDFFGCRLTGAKASLSLLALFIMVGLLSAVPFIVVTYMLDF